MAKTIKSATIDVKGISTKDILNADIFHMKGLTEKDLRNLTSRLVSTANKRLTRLEKSGQAEFSKAYNSRYQFEGKAVRFSVKNRNFNELQKELARVQKFLNEESSSVSGTKEQRERTKEYLRTRFAEEVGEFESEDDEKEFYKIFRDVMNKQNNLIKALKDSKQVRKLIYDKMVEGKSAKGIKISIGKYLNQEYRRQLDYSIANDSIQNVFELNDEGVEVDATRRKDYTRR